MFFIVFANTFCFAGRSILLPGVFRFAPIVTFFADICNGFGLFCRPINIKDCCIFGFAFFFAGGFFGCCGFYFGCVCGFLMVSVIFANAGCGAGRTVLCPGIFGFAPIMSIFINRNFFSSGMLSVVLAGKGFYTGFGTGRFGGNFAFIPFMSIGIDFTKFEGFGIACKSADAAGFPINSFFGAGCFGFKIFCVGNFVFAVVVMRSNLKIKGVGTIIILATVAVCYSDCNNGFVVFVPVRNNGYAFSFAY